MSIPKTGNSPSRTGWGAAAGASVVVLATAGVLTAPHLNVVGGTAVAQQSTVTLSAESDDELDVDIPALPGWMPLFLGASTDTYPSDRGIVANPGLREQGYVPTVIVTVDRLGPEDSGQDYARSLTRTLDRVSTVYEIAEREVCGETAYLTEFTDMGAGSSGSGTQSGTSIAVVPEEGDYAYIAVLQTRNPDNPSYIKQREAMLSGFCVGG